MFNFDQDKFDFEMVYDTIKQFYPPAISQDDSMLFESSVGLHALQQLLADNIHDAKHYEERWTSLEQELEIDSGSRIMGTTYGQAPSFSAYITLEEQTFDDLIRTKKLHFFVSLLGPYYTVIGEDANIVRVGRTEYRSTNYLFGSPVNDFTNIFEAVVDKLQDHFVGYRFVPFAVCKQTVDGLSLPYIDKYPATVFNALFNDHLDLAHPNVIGDKYYKAGDWIKKGYVETVEGWSAYPPPGVC